MWGPPDKASVALKLWIGRQHADQIQEPGPRSAVGRREQGIVMSVRVFVANDHEILRGALRAVINMQSDMEVVGEAATGRDAEIGIQKTEPDVVLMDISMPNGKGCDAIAAAKRLHFGARTVVLTFKEEVGYLRAARAVGYVAKSRSRSGAGLGGRCDRAGIRAAFDPVERQLGPSGRKTSLLRGDPLVFGLGDHFSGEIDPGVPSVKKLPANGRALGEPALDPDNSGDGEARMVKDVVCLPQPVLAENNGLAVTLSFHALAALD